MRKRLLLEGVCVMRMTVVNSLWFVAVALGASVSFAENALATPSVVPGPLAGVGLPVVVVGMGAYWLIRKLRNR